MPSAPEKLPGVRKRWYEKHKTKHLAAVRKNERLIKIEHRLLILDFFRSHPCVDCGEGDPVVLDFDHVRGTKSANISCLLGKSSSRAILAEIEKCDVRCANCHRRKTAKERGYYRKIDAAVLMVQQERAESS